MRKKVGKKILNSDDMRACVYSLKREREKKIYLIWKIKFNKKKLGKTRMWNFTRLHRDEVCVCVCDARK